MKSKLILVCIMVAISLCLFACLPTPKQASVNVSWDDFMKEQHISQEVEVAVDGSLTLSMYSCPSEGRQWSEYASPWYSWSRSVDFRGTQERREHHIYGIYPPLGRRGRANAHTCLNRYC